MGFKITSRECHDGDGAKKSTKSATSATLARKSVKRPETEKDQCFLLTRPERRVKSKSIMTGRLTSKGLRKHQRRDDSCLRRMKKGKRTQKEKKKRKIKKTEISVFEVICRRCVLLCLPQA